MNYKLLLILAIMFMVISMACAKTIADSNTPHVAVLVEPDMPIFAGQPSLPPGKIKAVLGNYEIVADQLNAAQLSDPNLFNIKQYSVLILAYGNSFPMMAQKNLRVFRSAGGAFVTNGIPFCHPAEFVNGVWRDMGGISYFGHDANGLGTGSFGNPVAGVAMQRVVEKNPLGFKQAMLPRINENLQWLDHASLGKKDEVMPLVETKLGENKFKPCVALIRHKCPQFNGAVDVWMGQMGSGLEEVDAYYMRQLLVRGVAWCLKEKGQLGQEQFNAMLKSLDNEKRPKPLPNNLDVVKAARPWGTSFLPKSNAPAKVLDVVKTRGLTREEKIALACLQGLTSRKQPCIWLNNDADDKFWLDWHKTKGYIGNYETVKDWKGLFKKYAAAYKGAVVPDTNLYRGELLAANVASCEDLIMMPQELAAELGIPVRIDMRGRFASYADGMRWVWKTYKNQLNLFLSDYIHPQWLEKGAFAYDVQWRGIMFWISGSKDGMLTGADGIKEMAVMSEIFAAMPPSTAVLGFPSCGDGVGLGEVGGTSFCGGYGKALVCTDRLANMCVTSGISISQFKQPKQAEAPVLQKDKIYISLVYSDGDNECMWQDYFKNTFINANYGKFSISFGMGPAIFDLQPAVAQWYYEHASPGTEFISDVSGIGYMRPDEYASKFKDKEAVLDDFLDWTDQYMKKMDMKTCRTVSGGDAVLKQYIQKLSFMHSEFADMGGPTPQGYENHTYILNGMPVFRSLIGWAGGQKGFIRDIRDGVGTTRPAFVNVMVHAWTFHDFNDLAKAVANMDNDMVLVTPSQLAELMKQAKAKGLAAITSKN